jgi:hypothetical protein
MTIEVHTDGGETPDIHIDPSTPVNPSIQAHMPGGGVRSIGTSPLYGPPGKDGKDGEDGQDGYSPTASVIKVDDTATITITDKNGTTTATITDGQDGQAGADGADGTDGIDGIDGFSPIAIVSKSGDTATISITDKNGTTTATISDGVDGRDGTDGVDGYSPTATVTKSGSVATITITDKNGTTTATVSDGAGSISDVQVDGISVVTNNVANITGKQDTLVSGTNIKTVNNNSLLGSGNVDIDGLPSQAGNAGKFLTTDGTAASWANVGTYEVGDTVWRLLPSTDAGKHLLDGALISYGSYAAFNDYIFDLLTSGTCPDLFYNEVSWQDEVTEYGVCGKFVYTLHGYAWTDGNIIVYTRTLDLPEEDFNIYWSTGALFGQDLLDDGYTLETTYDELSGITAKFTKPGYRETYAFTRSAANDLVGSVRLPKVTGIVEGTIDANALGDLVKAGLPNIKAQLNFTAGGGATASGAATVSTETSQGWGNSSGQNYLKFDINASRSSSLYKDSFNKVQPQTIKGYYYIVIATSVKTDIQVDIDEIATDLNGKADVDLTNVNNSGTSKGAGWALPSSTYKDLTLGASGSTYTAPANGWFYIQKQSNASGQYLNITNNTNGLSAETSSQGSNQSTREFLPVSKNDVIAISYSVAGATQVFRFIYAKGSESEAN